MTPTAGAAQPGLVTAFAAWERLPALAAGLSSRGSVHLVIDPAAGSILHASAAATPLAAAMTGSALIGLIRQVASAVAADAAPRLARLRLDPRRIAPPVLCWLARGEQANGRSAILLVPTAPVPPLRASRPDRSGATRSETRTPPVQAPASQDAPIQRGDRFLWRINAAGVVTTLSGSESLAGLVGQRWQDLAEGGRITSADAVLAALRDRRTFRGEPAVIDLGTGPFRVDLSGAPLGRGDAAFSGFGGFGLIRSVPALRAAPAETGTAIHAPAEAQDSRPEAVPTVAAAPRPADLREPVADESEPVAVPLSNDEHAAFREIARALGARYAGDEAEPGAQAAKTEGGAVMPFPAAQVQAAETRAAADAVSAPPTVTDVEPKADAEPAPEAEFLAGLPLPMLVSSAGRIVAANRRLLDLAGHPDLQSLARTGLSGLLPGLPPALEPDPTARRTTIATAEGGMRPVELQAAAVNWAGEAAACLIVRPVEEADVADALTAERLARAAQIERTAGAEAALDALETGVVTIDGVGRIVALNRAAADLFACNPREIVGGSFVALFERESVPAVADALRGAVPGQQAVLLTGAPVSLAVTAARSDGRRVALLESGGRRFGELGGDPGSGSASVRSGALARLGSAVREPVTGMVDLVDAMLKEPFGPLGDARYRRCLTEIRASGETMLERVGQLLDLAAVEAGALQLEPRAIDLNDVVAGCVARLQGEAARGRIVMRTSFSTDLGDLEADELSVSRAASLVIENAIRRSSAGGQIIVSTGSTERATVALRVRDTGAGAAPRIDAPMADVEDGLALPRALVEANGGRLQLSAKPEDGTLVEIIMPTRRVANG